jgi:aminoglycoside phosphotransferase (APT) family kinase protein
VAGIASGGRNPDLVRAGLERWLQVTLPDAHSVRLGPFEISERNGFSNETLIFDALIDSERGEHVARLVARLPPSGDGIFATYDLGRQAQVQRLVGEHGIPVARPIGHSSDDAWIGCPFLVMEFVAGRVPPNQPPYNVSGWLLDEPVAFREKLFQSVLAAMTAVHRLDVSGLDVAFLDPPSSGSTVQAELSRWAQYVHWACDGTLPSEIGDLLAWCRERLPRIDAPDVICWGDARFGNVVFAPDGAVAALLDWEMTSLGPGELDLGWFAAFRRQVAARTGRGGGGELDGFPGHTQMIESYEQLLGRAVAQLPWFEAFAMLKLAGMVMSTRRVVSRLGITDHFIYTFPPVESWVLELIGNA